VLDFRIFGSTTGDEDFLYPIIRETGIEDFYIGGKSDFTEYGEEIIGSGYQVFPYDDETVLADVKT